MAKKGPRILLSLVCSVCNSQNYITEKNKANTPDKLVLKKFCNKCRKITEHKERTKLK
jgi:large subunit ribosomal protein L33